MIVNNLKGHHHSKGIISLMILTVVKSFVSSELAPALISKVTVPVVASSTSDLAGVPQRRFSNLIVFALQLKPNFQPILFRI